MKDKLTSLLLFVARLSATLLVLALCLIMISKKVHQARMAAINQLMPSSYLPLFAASSGNERLTNNQLRHYLAYYSTIGAAVPAERAGAYALSAFCSFYLKDDARAALLFKKAIDLQPDFFWNYYNLGVIYFNAGNFEKANDLFEKALALPPEKTLRIALSSKIYTDLLQESRRPDFGPEHMLLQGYQQAFAYRALCHKDQKRPTAETFSPAIRVF